MILTFVLGGFGSVAYAWTSGRVGLGSRGVTIHLYELPHTDPVGLFATWTWSHPEWYHAAWWRSDRDLFAFGCSLFLPGVVLGLVAGARWYRHWRPFHRKGRANRAYQFWRLRWLATLATLLSLAAAIAGEWRLLEWLTPFHRVSIGAGRLWWSNSGSDTVSWVGKVTIEPPQTATPPAYFVLYEWLHLGPQATLEVSLWMVVSLAAIAAAILWFVRFRFYPTDGRCANPACGYDLTGLDPTAPCPECGGGGGGVPRPSERALPG